MFSDEMLKKYFLKIKFVITLSTKMYFFIEGQKIATTSVATSTTQRILEIARCL